MRGLNNPQKKYVLKNCILEKKVDVLILKEVKITVVVFQKVVDYNWLGSYLFTNEAFGASGGIITM